MPPLTAEGKRPRVHDKAFTMRLLTMVTFAKVSPPLGYPPAGFGPPLAPSGNVKVGHEGPPTHPKTTKVRYCKLLGQVLPIQDLWLH